VCNSFTPRLCGVACIAWTGAIPVRRIAYRILLIIVTGGVDSPSILAATRQIAAPRPAPIKQVLCQPLTDKLPEYRLLEIDHGDG
jgi:hypothetical protein